MIPPSANVSQFARRLRNPNSFHHTLSAPYSTPGKIKEKLADMKTKLLTIKSNYERSGNGTGQMATDGQQQGLSTPTMDGADKKNFLKQEKPSLLYMWELFQESQILDHTLYRLGDSTGVNSDTQPRPTTSRRGRSARDDAAAREREDVFRDHLSESLREIAETGRNQAEAAAVQAAAAETQAAAAETQASVARANSRLAIYNSIGETEREKMEFN